MVKIAAAQLPASEDMDENFRAALRYIERAAREGAELVCFPEGHLSRYAPQYQGLAAGAFAIPPEHPYMGGLPPGVQGKPHRGLREPLP
jgi:predicted amidohydrolase